MNAIEEPEIRHYPLAIADHIQRGIEKATREGKRDEFLFRVDELLDSPAMQYRPLPQALRFHKSIKKFRWCLGGNRSSKSTSSVMEVFYFLTGFHPFQEVPQNCVGWHCTLNFEMVGSILWEKLEPLFEKMLSRGSSRVSWHNRGRGIPESLRVFNATGESRVIFKAYEQGPDAFQGTDRRFICADEQMPQQVYIEMITRIGSKYPLSFWSPFTPIKPQPFLEEKLTANVPENYDIFEFPLDDNRVSRGGFIPDTEIDQTIADWPDEVMETRRNGKWGSYLGAVYKSFNRQVHIVKESDENKFFTTPITLKNLHTIGGLDFGGADPFVYLWMVRIPHMKNAWYLYDEYHWDSRAKGVHRLLKEHYQEIQAKNKKWGCSILRTWADHDLQDRNELFALGLPTMLAIKEIPPGIESVQKVLKYKFPERPPQFYISERCKESIREMVAYHYPDEKPTRNVGDLPVDKWNHCVDPIRYIIHGETANTMGGLMAGSASDRRTF